MRFIIVLLWRQILWEEKYSETENTKWELAVLILERCGRLYNLHAQQVLGKSLF